MPTKFENSAILGYATLGPVRTSAASLAHIGS
jgi:hypothetical protein